MIVHGAINTMMGKFVREPCGLLCNFDGCKEFQESRVMNDRIKHGPEKEGNPRFSASLLRGHEWVYSRSRLNIHTSIFIYLLVSCTTCNDSLYLIEL